MSKKGGVDSWMCETGVWARGLGWRHKSGITSIKVVFQALRSVESIKGVDIPRKEKHQRLGWPQGLLQLEVGVRAKKVSK